MNMVVFTLIFGVFIVGVVLVGQGFIGREPTFKHQHLLDRPTMVTQVEHPPERHRVRLMLIGAGLIVIAIVATALWA